MSAHGPSMPVTPSPKRRLMAALALAGVYLVAEVIGGVWSGSLALLADAGHMLTDVGGLALALLAMRFAERPPTPERTYGFYRAEILAALTNAVLLIGISLYILWEAYQRFRHPPEVAGGMMLLVAVIGLLSTSRVCLFFAEAPKPVSMSKARITRFCQIFSRRSV